MLPFWIALLFYFCSINCIAVIATCIDKRRAKRSGWRIPERNLLCLGLMGGALAEWLVMRRIRHKTTRKKFMIGLPLMVLLHAAVCGVLLYFFH